MFDLKYLFFNTLLHSIVAVPQINLYFTDRSSRMQYDCLRIAATVDQSNVNRQIMSYCISESLLNYTNNYFPKFTFAELSKANISSQQLYLWSAPIDLIEDYQFYLNQLSLSNHSSLKTNIFYNCTWPRFGSMCQYEFNNDYHSNYTSLYQIIYDWYHYNEYKPTNLTCYNHLECNRGPDPSCLDWSEICDGKIDCQDNGFDEEHCWQLEVNECRENEYRCANGQCIPLLFHLDESKTPDCLDQSDEYRISEHTSKKCITHEPSFGCEDVTCKDTPLTSSCIKQRKELLIRALYSIKDNDVSDDCWSAFKCVTDMPQPVDPICSHLCENQNYVKIIDQMCPDMILMPAVPVLFHDIYFAYNKNDAQYLNCAGLQLPYTCSNNSRYNEWFVHSPKVIFNNLTCYRDDSFFEMTRKPIWEERYLMPPYIALRKYTLTSKYTSEICNRSNMYQCIDSPKCISIHRLMDGIDDCPRNDDESITRINNADILKQVLKNHFKCQTSNKYIPQSSIANGICDCGKIEPTWCEDEDLNMNYIRRNISFQTICDGFIELSPIIINGRNETDETECEQWLCNNIYTRCNNLWNCPNGEDEVGCDPSPPLNCSSNEHICVSPRTNQLMCLPLTKINDGNADCLGGFDEPNLYRRKYDRVSFYDFHCMNDSSKSYVDYYWVCNARKDCAHGDDEQFCNPNRTVPIDAGICLSFYSSMRSFIEEFICETMQWREKKQIVYFSLDRIENIEFPSSSIINKSQPQQQHSHCHRGLDLRLWLDNDNNLITCLCPPSYYGSRCQYQNQRVSLSIQFRASSHSWRTPFAILISLIDDERIIHSYEQFSYLSIRDCKIKFNVYLLYSTRPKNQSKHYAIQIDIYEKISLDHRSSLFVPIRFPFLPVHRLAFIVDIPQNNDSMENCFDDPCNHGKCLRYFNSPQNATFCQCDRGWTGRFCTIPYTCLCSSDSLCIGIAADNRSVCVCPLHRFGPRCLLTSAACSTCQNGGQCIPNDEYIESDPQFTCICPKGFIGRRCEIVDNKIILSFGKDLTLPQSIFIHFIRVISDDRPRRSTTFRTIPFKQDSIIIYWSQPFHLVFIEFPDHKNYYLTVIQNIYNQSTTIDSSNRCRHINELFNQTIIQLHLLRRIKYYQIPCQKYSPELSCFYDDIHLCLCQQHRANCFEFNHNMTFNCLGQSVCENGAQCFQDTFDCPQRSMCVCPPCFYGIRCQFNTNTFGLSLDGILGYHIQPHVRITQQMSIVQTSIALAIIFIIIGFLNGILAIITFRKKSVREVGCGLYLLGSSITTLLITMMFGLKFWILILAQMGIIVNRSFLSFQCHLIEFLFRCCFVLDQWFNACVAIERAITTVQSTRFNKMKSKQIARIVIITLLIIILATNIHDPIYRRLIDEENDDEKRTWCIVTYPSRLQTFNSFMYTFHLLVPFIINLISAIILITKKSQQLSTIHTRRTYRQLLRKQCQQHKHLFISPIVLVILAIPRLIISFARKCMKSADDSWLFLFGYFISLIPPILTFVVFVLPSKFYMRELRKSLIQYQRGFSVLVKRLTIWIPNRIHPI